jgi:rhodanese-related sulfurtransferase
MAKYRSSKLASGDMKVNPKKSIFLLSMIALLAFSALASTEPRPVIADKESSQDETFPTMSVDELILMMAKKKPVVVIDVRHPDAYTEKIIGALQIPYDQIESHLKDIPRNKPVIAYCACPTEATSGAAVKALIKNGYKNVYALKGGWNSWVLAAGKTEQKK